MEYPHRQDYTKTAFELGERMKLNKEQQRKIIEITSGYFPPKTLKKEFGIHPSTAYRILNKNNLPKYNESKTSRKRDWERERIAVEEELAKLALEEAQQILNSPR